MSSMLCEYLIESKYVKCEVPCESHWLYSVNGSDWVTEGQLTEWWNKKIKAVVNELKGV